MKAETPFFSIIIPIYNGLEHYCPDCLESIWSQSLDKSKYEVICVDDCSNDKTWEWLNDQKKSHSNLRIIKNDKNLRQGGSRNNGIRQAIGKYIIFIDQDDYFHKNSITEAFNILNKNDLDVCVCDAAWQIRGNESNTLIHNYKHRACMVGDDFIGANTIPFAPWKFIIRREFITNNNLYFKEGVRLEDVDWSLKLCHNAKKIQYFPILFIHYNRGDGSTTWDSHNNLGTIINELEMGNRCFSLYNTIFSQSNTKCKSVVLSIVKGSFRHALIQMLGVSTNIKLKTEAIKANIKEPELFNNGLISFAQKWPTIFAMCSVISIPFYRTLHFLYRKFKYNA